MDGLPVTIDPAVPKRRWVGVVLSLFVPGFGLVRAGHVVRGLMWFVGLYLGIIVISFVWIWTALPVLACYAATVLLFAAQLAMLVDSFRPGRLTIPLFVVFALLFIVFATLPPPSDLIAHCFKIPTGTMQPTLNGIIGYPTNKSAPNLIRRVVDFIIRGRNYIDVVSQQDDQILQLQLVRRALFFTMSRIVCEHQTFLVYAPPDTLRDYFGVVAGRRFKRGEVIARGSIDAGDQIVADKFTYKCVAPRRGDIVVIRTNGIPLIREDPVTGAPLYIKRLAGLPGDTVRIEPPVLYVNGQLAEGPGFKNVMEAMPPYRGYALGPIRPGDEVRVPQNSYFVLGDNSYNSFDSRYWGCVPAANVLGRVARVYYPFSRARVPQ